MKKNPQMRPSEKGQSLVELAVAIMIMLVLLAGVVDLGSMIFQFLAMRDAAQEGASLASIYPDSCNQAIERVRANLHNADPEEIQVTVTIDGVACHLASPSNACASKEVIVTVRQEHYELRMPLIGAFIGSQSIPLETSIANTILRPACP